VATTRLGQIGVGVQPYPGFDPKDPAPTSGPHNPGVITRLCQIGVGVSRYGTFQPKSQAEVEVIDALTGGKGDNAADEKRKKKHGRTTFKPTGLIDRPARKQTVVDARVEQSHDVAKEIAAERAARESALRAPAPQPVVTMTLAEIEREIATLLHKKLRTQDDEMILLLLMAAATA